jgi:hypothetical protein
MMMMIMMSHDAYTHQKSKSFSSPDSWNDYPPHPFLLVLTKPNHYKTQPPPPLFPLTFSSSIFHHYSLFLPPQPPPLSL